MFFSEKTPYPPLVHDHPGGISGRNETSHGELAVLGDVIHLVRGTAPKAF
jgi:hypothetical protein